MTPSWLSQLAPAHPPPPPGWWPPAPGWWLLAVLLLAAAAAVVWWWRDPYRRSRRAALRELRAIRAEEDSDIVASARAIESLLRRFAVAVFGAARVARLTGDAWLAFVAAQGGTELAGNAGRSLLATAFGGGPSDDLERWIAGADAFVRHAQRNTQPARTEAG
jgi:hypothetical protein